MHDSRMLYRFAAILPLVIGCASAGTPDQRGVTIDSGSIEVFDSPPRPDSPPIPDAPSGCVTQMRDLLVNGSFDDAPLATGWSQSDTSIVTPTDGVPEQTAPNKAWLGGVAQPFTLTMDDLHQDVMVPAGTTSLVLTGFFDVRTGEDPADPGPPYDSGKAELVTPGGSLIEAIGDYDNARPQTGWVPVSHTFTTNLAGQTVRLRFTTSNDGVNATSFYFDTLALTATFCQ